MVVPSSPASYSAFSGTAYQLNHIVFIIFTFFYVSVCLTCACGEGGVLHCMYTKVGTRGGHWASSSVTPCAGLNEKGSHSSYEVPSW